ncbi:CKAP2: Cytoskeleton-associated protein 2 [Crotalus adamanteus]|uniref:CKAP2: Cytoskeleton-associated protein 2 n=1 Tax=Crotalus adamanteus TaxID=8729 RepID=A0AAW1BPR2_CROAD
MHEKANKTSSMLKDHRPCVSFLQELGELRDEGTVFIYKSNHTLQTVSVNMNVIVCVASLLTCYCISSPETLSCEMSDK